MFDIGIIGTAGRGAIIKHLSLEKFNKMVNAAEKFIEEFLLEKSDSWSKIHLVSGGAAWADHVAIKLYLKHPTLKLSLFFPCKFDKENDRFEDNQSDSYYTNPGKNANRYHIYFKNKTGIESLKEISYVIEQKNVKVIDKYKGFKNRNIQVGKVEVLLAFSFEDEEPNTTGTKHTWNNSKAFVKENFNINKL